MLVAGAAWAFSQHVPCEFQAFLIAADTPEPPLAQQPAATSGVVTGDVSQSVAAANRVYLESQDIAALPGPVLLDQALTVKSGTVLGGGSIRNGYYSATFPLNCSAMAGGAGCGYVDGVTRISATKWRLNDPAQAVNYHAGGVLHAFVYDGYGTPAGQLCTRRTIADVTGAVVTLTSGIDPRCNSFKSYAIAAPIIQDIRPGQTSVSVQNTATATLFAAGDYVMLTAGPDLANADHCEFARVVGVLNFSVQLALPTQRAYRNPVIAKMQPVRDVTLKNLTLDVPVNTGSNTLFVRYGSGWRLENATINGHLGLAGCSNVTLVNCTIGGELGIGSSCHGITLIGCRVSRMACEESCFDLLATGCTFGPHAVPLQSSVGCERLTFRACRVTGGDNMPVSIGGPDCTFDDFAIEATTRSLYAYFSGDRLRIRNLRCDANCEPVLYGGRSISVQGVTARQTNLGWEFDGSNSEGNALDCQNPVKRQGRWVP